MIELGLSYLGINNVGPRAEDGWVRISQLTECIDTGDTPDDEDTCTYRNYELWIVPDGEFAFARIGLSGDDMTYTEWYGVPGIDLAEIGKVWVTLCDAVNFSDDYVLTTR